MRFNKMQKSDESYRSKMVLRDYNIIVIIASWW